MTRTALVTGATRGIGRASAVALARLGYDVAITGRTRSEGDDVVEGSLESTAAAIESAGQRAVPLVMDLLDGASLQPVAEAAIAELGHVDVLLNNAIYVGPLNTARFLDYPIAELEKRVYGNITAQLVFTQPVLRHMAARGRGLIAGTTSAAGLIPPRLQPDAGGWTVVYGVTKAGFNRIGQQLAIEHPELRFLNLQPGFVVTERIRAVGREHTYGRGAPVEAVGEAIARILDQPEEYASGSTLEVQDLARAWGLLPG